MIKEACVETLQQCINAQRQGADRLELCADLAQDGLTPAIELIQEVQAIVDIPVRVMIRPKAGDFIYSEDEIISMEISIDQCKEIGVEGVVFGICNEVKKLDISRIDELATNAKPLKVIVHKAIDDCIDPVEEVDKLKSLKNVDAVLTSGKSTTALEGIEYLKSMIEAAGADLEIIACGKVTNDNLLELDNTLQAKAYHGKLMVGVI